ncbi:hypothetical protein BU24DRAFT_454480 [Aaosphaeria arxii CBS 175.79]|uniref:Uncharacterized protein n=1 Tax=Aaosphaeria arxii CBS 175.79 TaxID=1450172 RepID=A0A6A5XDK5_9PLEO|nr:uncharacterized protein BU24DRAFT_454480 [Aaosphaeria arxii CBS 175.79]KAF2010953.1 hypothetical protein BU24DRAFT_454480 [Aaosphaeria arxii CBS 175.79]
MDRLDDANGYANAAYIEYTTPHSLNYMKTNLIKQVMAMTVYAKPKPPNKFLCLYLHSMSRYPYNFEVTSMSTYEDTDRAIDRNTDRDNRNVLHSICSLIILLSTRVDVVPGDTCYSCHARPPRLSLRVSLSSG